MTTKCSAATMSANLTRMLNMSLVIGRSVATGTTRWKVPWPMVRWTWNGKSKHSILFCDFTHRWNGHDYEVQRGHYERKPHPNAQYVAGHWEKRDRGHTWVEGHGQ